MYNTTNEINTTFEESSNYLSEWNTLRKYVSTYTFKREYPENLTQQSENEKKHLNKEILRRENIRMGNHSVLRDIQCKY